MATGTTEFITHSVVDAIIPEVWSMQAIVAREAELLMADLCNRVFEKELASFGDRVHVPSVSNLTVQTKTFNAKAATIYEAITETNTTIIVDTWQYQALALETAAKRQANRDMLEVYAPKQGYALGLAIDDVLAGLIDDLTNNVGVLAQGVSYADALRAIQYLDDADVPQEDRTFVISPAQKAGFMQLPEFVHGDLSKLNEGTKVKGKKATLGTWMGIPVMWSTNIEGTNAAGHDNGLFHKEAFALIVQMEPTTHTQFDIDYFLNKVAIEQLHGSKEMRDDHGVWVKGL